MTSHSAAEILLAQRHNWQRLGDRFSGSNAKLDVGELVAILAACIVAGLLLWLLQWTAKWQEGKLDSPSPGRLFRDLCRAHKLRFKDRRLLKRLAQGSHIDHPVELFLKPEAFNIGRIPADLEHQATAILALAERLFAEAPNPQEPGPKSSATNEKPETSRVPASISSGPVESAAESGVG